MTGNRVKVAGTGDLRIEMGRPDDQRFRGGGYVIRKVD
jgi:hypothetical protein